MIFDNEEEYNNHMKDVEHEGNSEHNTEWIGKTLGSDIRKVLININDTCTHFDHKSHRCRCADCTFITSNRDKLMEHQVRASDMKNLIK